MVALPVWFAEPPILNGPDTYTIVEAKTQAEYDKIKAQGNVPEFATQAQAEAFVKARNGSFTLSPNAGKAIIQAATGNATAAGQSKPAMQDLLQWPQFSNLRGLMIRVVKVVGGLVMVMAGLNMLAKSEAHIDVVGSVKSAAKIGAVAA